MNIGPAAQLAVPPIQVAVPATQVAKTATLNGTPSNPRGVAPVARPPGDVLAIAPAQGPAVQVRFVSGDKVFDREAILGLWQPVTAAKPALFFNFRETLVGSDAGNAFRAIGSAPGGLKPVAGRFCVTSAHANGNAESGLETGVRFANSGKEPIAVRLDGLDVLKGARGEAGSGKKPWTVVVPPGGSVDLGLAQSAAHSRNGSPRDGTRPVVFRLEATVVSGDPAALAVHDIARFPKAKAAGGVPASSAAPVPLHHEGVFYPQRQVTAPPVLGPDNAAYIKIRGSNDKNDAHYYVDHQAFVAIPAGRPPKTIVFGGPGGITRPEVGGRRLPAIGNVLDPARPDVERGGERFRNLARHLEFSLPLGEAVRQGYLRRTDNRDPHGNPIYQIDVRFVAGDNGDLLVYGTW